MQIVIFVFSFFYYFYFNLVGINQKYVTYLLTYCVTKFFLICSSLVKTQHSGLFKKAYRTERKCFTKISHPI